MNRLAGHLRLRAARRDHGRTVLAAQDFRAPFHLSKPYWDADASVLLAQVVNPTAGILAGDELDSRIVVDGGAALLVTTPSASRVFQMKGGQAASRQSFEVAADGWLEVLPEPLVPHRGSRFHQTTEIDVAAGGRLLFVDQLMPGRLAHGEAWHWDRLQLDLSVRVGGDLALRERWDFSGPELAELAAFSGSGPTACFANVLLISSDDGAGSWRPSVEALHGDGVKLGVSALRRGGWSLKVVATDPVHLRATLRELRRQLVPSFPRLACDPRKL